MEDSVFFAFDRGFKGLFRLGKFGLAVGARKCFNLLNPRLVKAGAGHS
jgi:hypothetical protein